MTKLRSVLYSATFRCEGRQTIPVRSPVQVHRIVAELNGRHAGTNLTESEDVSARHMWLELPFLNLEVRLDALLANREEPLLDDDDEPILDGDGNPRTHRVRGARLHVPIRLDNSVELQLVAAVGAREALPEDWHVSVVLVGHHAEELAAGQFPSGFSALGQSRSRNMAPVMDVPRTETMNEATDVAVSVLLFDEIVRRIEGLTKQIKSYDDYRCPPCLALRERRYALENLKEWMEQFDA